MAETEDEERDAKRIASNVTMNTFFHKSTATTNTQGNIANVTNERRISSDIPAETIKGFNELTIQSTIKDSEYYDSEVMTQKVIQTAIQR